MGKVLRVLLYGVLAFGLLGPALLFAVQRWFPPKGSEAGEWVGQLQLSVAGRGRVVVEPGTPQVAGSDVVNGYVVHDAPRLQQAAAIYMHVMPISSMSMTPDQFKGYGWMRFASSGRTYKFRVSFTDLLDGSEYRPKPGDRVDIMLVFEDAERPPQSVANLQGVFTPGTIQLALPPAASKEDEHNWYSAGMLHKGSLADFEQMRP